MCTGVDKVDEPSFKICKKFQETMRCGADFPLCFDLRLSSHSVIHIDRSRLGEQTRALVELLQSSVGQWRRNTIHMFYRQDLKGVVNAIKRQTPFSNTGPVPPIQWPSARRPRETQLWHKMSDCSRKCFSGAVKVLDGGGREGFSRALRMRMTCAVAEQIQQLSRVWGPNGQGFKSRL